jgi:hypothetical protein
VLSDVVAAAWSGFALREQPNDAEGRVCD